MGRAFVDAAGTAILKNKANLLNVTIRSVEKDHDSLLRYAPEQRDGLCHAIPSTPYTSC